LSDDRRLGARARTLIEDPGNDVLVSAVSLWEIAVEVRVGKLEADVGEIADVIEREGLTLLGLDTTHLLALVGLPKHHRDPFDHLLMAQAIVEDADFVSGDRYVAGYPVRVIGCADG
jgi:PIN domain nuclease of toxin-antitoxin system